MRFYNSCKVLYHCFEVGRRVFLRILQNNLRLEKPHLSLLLHSFAWPKVRKFGIYSNLLLIIGTEQKQLGLKWIQLVMSHGLCVWSIWFDLGVVQGSHLASDQLKVDRERALTFRRSSVNRIYCYCLDTQADSEYHMKEPEKTIKEWLIHIDNGREHNWSLFLGHVRLPRLEGDYISPIARTALPMTSPLLEL
jgi:hypothetical protein